MKIGIISDTHDQHDLARNAVQLLRDEGAETLIHCGDLAGPEMVAICAVLPFYFVFGNHDADAVPELTRAANETGATCLGWGGVVVLATQHIAVVHGHMRYDLERVMKPRPDYLLSGHSHFAMECMDGTTRRINPGALHQTEQPSVALLDLVSDDLRFLPVSP